MKKITQLLIGFMVILTLAGCTQKQIGSTSEASKKETTAVYRFVKFEQSHEFDKQKKQDKSASEFGADEAWGRDEYEFYYFSQPQKIGENKAQLGKNGTLVSGPDFVIVLHKDAKDDTKQKIRSFR